MSRQTASPSREPRTDGSGGPVLAQRSVAGGLWFLLQTVCIKASAVITQIGLAYLLAPQDFGLIGLALTFTAFTDVLYQNGLAQTLVQRSEDVDRLSRHAFWLSMAIGGVGTVGLVALAPLAGLVFDAPEVTSLIWVLALAVPIDAASVVPRTRLIADLAYSKLARISGAQLILQNILSLLFAWAGFGPYSFALPIPLSALVVLWLYRRESPLEVHWPIDASGWRSLVRDTVYLLGTTWLAIVVAQGDYFLLGLFVPPAAVGLYFFAFRLSAQTVNVVTQNIGRVLFPALVQMPAMSTRQHNAFLRTTRVVAGIGVPLSIGGVVFGEDVIRLAFDEQWYDAAPLLQILCIAFAIKTVAESYRQLLKAQGRFRESFTWSLLTVPFFLVAVPVGAWTAEATGVAWAVVIYAAMSSWFMYYQTTKPVGGDLWELWRVMAGPAVAATATCLAAVIVGDVALGLTGPSGRRLALGMAATAVGYLPLLHLVSRPTSRELVTVSRYLIAQVGRLRTGRRRTADDAAG